jgi:hypothetical protein
MYPSCIARYGVSPCWNWRKKPGENPHKTIPRPWSLKEDP